MFLQVQPTALQRPVQSSENQLETKKKEEEEEEGGSLASKRGCVMDRGSWLGAEYGRNSGVIGL